MAVEIEAKMKLDDADALEIRLAEAGAMRGRDVVQINTYLDTPQGSLQQSDQGLRVRVEQEANGPNRQVIMTYKGPQQEGPFKRRTEIELSVSDGQAATELLAAIGFTKRQSFEKRRRHWRLDGCSVEIDTLPYLGDFVEIEGPSQQAIHGVRDKLGLDASPLIQTSYIAMLEAYRTRHRITDPDLTL